MTRDERVVTLLGPGGDVASAASPPSSFYDKYLSDAYHWLADEETRRVFGILHKTVSLVQVQSALDIAALMSVLNPSVAQPYQRHIWTPVSSTDNTLDPAPSWILGVKATVSTEADWVDAVSYNSDTGVVSGLPNDGNTYWIPEMGFFNAALTSYVMDPQGIKQEWIPPNLDETAIPKILGLTEWVMQVGPTETALTLLGHAWAGGGIQYGDTGWEATEALKCSLTTDVPAKETSWSLPIRVTSVDPQKGRVVLGSAPPATLEARMNGRVRYVPEPGSGDTGADVGGIIRYVSGQTVWMDGVLQTLGSRWAFFQHDLSATAPVGAVTLSVTTTGTTTEVDRTRQVLAHLIDKLDLGLVNFTLAVS